VEGRFGISRRTKIQIRKRIIPSLGEKIACVPRQAMEKDEKQDQDFMTSSTLIDFGRWISGAFGVSEPRVAFC
jgi:hypothetical protein